MEPIVVLVVVGLALMTGLVVLATIAGRRRRENLQAWARERGWRYRDGDRDLARTLRGGPFGTGQSRRSDEILEGAYRGIDARSFRYTYTTTSTDSTGRPSRTDHHFHVVSLALPATLPTIELTPETVATRAAKAFGARDTDFESEAFNRAWRVHGPDAQVTYDVVHPRMMELLMTPDMAGQNLLIEGGALLWWRRGRPDLADVGPALERLRAVRGLVPEFVWDNFRR